jgi:hypothetical protein
MKLSCTDVAADDKRNVRSMCSWVVSGGMLGGSSMVVVGMLVVDRVMVESMVSRKVLKMSRD